MVYDAYNYSYCFLNQLITEGAHVVYIHIIYRLFTGLKAPWFLSFQVRMG